MQAIAKGIVGVAGLGIAAFAGTTALEDNTTRNDDGEIVESGGLGAFQMQVGDCFNRSVDEDAELVASVEGMPCSVPHDNEVFAEFDVTPAAIYPGEDPIYEEAWFACQARFEDWVGRPYEESILEINVFTPSAGSWAEGDREATCFVFDLNGQKLSISTKASGL